MNAPVQPLSKRSVYRFVQRSSNKSLSQKSRAEIKDSILPGLPESRRFYESLQNLPPGARQAIEKGLCANLDETSIVESPTISGSVSLVRHRRNWAGASPKNLRKAHLSLLCCSTTCKPLHDVAIPLLVFPFKATIDATALHWRSGFDSHRELPFISTENGWVTKEAWDHATTWFIRMLRDVAKVEGDFVLFLDCAVGHITTSALNQFRDANIHVITFPSHATHLLQPLDLKIFGPFKKLIRSTVSAHYDEVFHGNLLHHRLDLNTFVQLLQGPWERASTYMNQLASFRDSGLAPLNLTLIDASLQLSRREALSLTGASVVSPLPAPALLRQSLRDCFPDETAESEGFSGKRYITPSDICAKSSFLETLQLFYEVNYERLRQPFTGFALSLRDCYERAEISNGVVDQATLQIPPRFLLGHAHTPQRVVHKTRASILKQMGGRVATSSEALELVAKSEAVAAEKAAKKGSGRKGSKVVSKEDMEAADAAKAVVDAKLAAEAPLRAIAIQMGLQVNDQKRLSKAILLDIAEHLDADYSPYGNRESLMQACLDTLPSGDSDGSDQPDEDS